MQVLFCLLLLLGGQGVWGLKQYLEFYNTTTTCTGRLPERYFLNSAINVRSNSSTNPFQSINVFGIWQIGRCPSGQQCVPTSGTEVRYTTHISNLGTCEAFDSGTVHSFWDVKLLGDPGMTLAELQLFNETNFSVGSRVVMVTNQGLLNTPPIDVKSFFFSGVHAWTLYDNVEYKGRGTCLYPGADVRTRGYGFTSNISTDISAIRSVRYGCNGCPTLSPLPPLVLLIFTHYLVSYFHNKL